MEVAKDDDIHNTARETGSLGRGVIGCGDGLNEEASEADLLAPGCFRNPLGKKFFFFLW